MRKCAAIAEVESGEIVKNSLLAPPPGMTHVKRRLVVFRGDPWGDLVARQEAQKREKEAKDMEEETKKEGIEKMKQEETGQNNEGTLEDGSLVGGTSDAGSSGNLLTASAASAALLSLNGSRCGMMGEGRVPEKALEGAGERK